MTTQREEEIIMKELEKIINSNKSKASNLRNCLLNLNRNIYTNELHFQIIQFLGEFEYDLKTLYELFCDFKSKIEHNFQNNMNSVFSEVNSLKKENLSLKELIENSKIKTSKENNPIYNSYKPRNSKSNKNIKTTNDTNQKFFNKTKSLYLHLKNPNIKKKLKEMIKSKNRNKNKTFTKNLNMTNDKEYRSYIKENQKQNIIQRSAQKIENEKDNLNLLPYKRKQNSFSEINFYKNKSNTSSNLSNKKFFYDYDNYLTNLKRNSLYHSNINLIKYDNYLENKIRNNNANNTDLNEIARGKCPLVPFDEDKKQKLMLEIFRDEKILNELKKQFGNDIENKLLNEDIDSEFYKKIEEITDKIKTKLYYTPKNRRNGDIIDNISAMEENMSYNFKIPKRFSNKKNENSKSNLINSNYH